MKHLNSLKFVVAILCFLSLSACTNDQDEDGVPDDKDKCKNTPSGVVVDKDGCPIKERKLGNINFYLDNSASMAGYFGQQAEFKTIISDLVVKVEKNIKPISIWFISASETKYPFNTQKFTSDIATTKMATQDGFQLHEMITRIAAKNDTNDISFLVSDCILSFPSEDIKKKPEINKEEAPNALKNNIYSTFSDLKKKNLATSVYAFNSKFYGTYYDYQNGKHELKGDNRPFYLWVIGHKELLGKFNAQLQEISTFKPEQSLHFGLSEEPVSTYDIIPQIDGIGKWTKEVKGGGIKGVEVSKTKPVQFCVALNLTNLPDYAKTISYLQNNIQIDNKGCVAVITVKDKSKIDKAKLKSQQQIAAFERATHFITITLKEMSLNDASIQLSMPLHYDTWYMSWSVPDDKDLKTADKKTFALEHLINGVKEAYETKNKSYLALSITLKK